MSHDESGRLPEFLRLPDLAVRSSGASVLGANNELFAERENLIKDAAPTHAPSTFGLKGQVYDGWETRRRREPGSDWAVVRLGMAGVVRGVVIDTAFFTGNAPPEVSVDGCGVEGYPSLAQLHEADWRPLLPRSPVAANARNSFAVDLHDRVTHVRLSLHPDGGVARLRVHGNPIPDPRTLAAEWVDLAAARNGGAITGCSNAFYSVPGNLIASGAARTMGEGWETARRRNGGNDWVEIRLARAGTIRMAELDTTHFIGNAPGWATLRGYDERLDITSSGPNDDHAWIDLLARTSLQPDTCQQFRPLAHPPVTHVRLDVYPDGGMARLRLHGIVSTAERDRIVLDWFNSLPASHARATLKPFVTDEGTIAQLTDARPLRSCEDLPAPFRARVFA